MLVHAIFFYFFSFIAIFSAIMVTVSKNTVHSVFFLILDFISISFLFIMIGAEFLGMIMLIVYVGAVAILFLFVVMMLNVAQQKNEWFSSEIRSTHIPIGLLVSLIIFSELIIVIGGWKYKPNLTDSISLKINSNITNTESLGNVIYTDYVHLFQLSGMILLVAMIGAEFLGMIMLIVYVGAVAILFLFVVMMLNVAQQKSEWFASRDKSTHIPIGLLVSLIIFFELIIVIGGWKYKPGLVNSISIEINPNATNTELLGNLIYTDYIHLFQLSGMILLVAMVGAIVLTFRKRSGVKKQSYLSQISREKKDGVELVKPESNKGVKIDV